MKQLIISKQITNRDNFSIDRYLKEIAKIEMINADEEFELAGRIRHGDTIALEKLTKANLRFVVSVAKQYQNRGLTLGDLISEGNLGLIKAAQRFDETRGFKFISYAVWWIRQSMTQAISEQSRIVRLPLNRIGSLTKILRKFSDLEQEFQRMPAYDEIAEAMEISVDEVSSSFISSGRHISFDAPLHENEEWSLKDVYVDKDEDAPDDNLLIESLKSEIESALRTLTSRESTIISDYFGLNGDTPLTLDEIGTKFKLTRERVRQIKEKATRRLRYVSRSKNLRSYL